MNALERLSYYLSELPKKKQQLYCRYIDGALYLPNSDEFFVKEVRNNDSVCLCLFSNKVKNRLVTIAKLRERRYKYGRSTCSFLTPKGFKLEGGNLYLYISNSSSCISFSGSTGGRTCIYRYNLSIGLKNIYPKSLGTFYKNSDYRDLLSSQNLIRIV